jgi:osmotically-inducible protein OsmY
MKKRSKIWQGALIAGITACAVPSFAQGQTTGTESTGRSSGMTSGSSSASETHKGASERSGMTGSAGASGMSHSMSKVDKDMGSTEADQRLNSQIRQALNADTSLAGVGRNVYFNTKNGEVTLQGSVSSEAEKNQIEQKVKQMSNVGNVKNELQVANMGSSSAMGGSSKSSTSTGTTSSSSTGTTNR